MSRSIFEFDFLIFIFKNQLENQSLTIESSHFFEFLLTLKLINSLGNSSLVFESTKLMLNQKEIC